MQNFDRSGTLNTNTESKVDWLHSLNTSLRSGNAWHLSFLDTRWDRLLVTGFTFRVSWAMEKELQEMQCITSDLDYCHYDSCGQGKIEMSSLEQK